jgi:hypothetical protein
MVRRPSGTRHAVGHQPRWPSSEAACPRQPIRSETVRRGVEPARGPIQRTLSHLRRHQDMPVNRGLAGIAVADVDAALVRVRLAGHRCVRQQGATAERASIGRRARVHLPNGDQTPGICGDPTAIRHRREQPKNGGLSPGFEGRGRTTENRGVPGSSPGLVIANVLQIGHFRGTQVCNRRHELLPSAFPGLFSGPSASSEQRPTSSFWPAVLVR